VFVEYTTTVAASLSAVEKSLDRVRANLEEWADIAYREGEALMARVGPTPAVVRRVRLEIRVAEIHTGGLVYPVHWTVDGAAGLFPQLEADLWLTKLGSRETRMTLKGTYQPPLGPLGRLADRALLGRVAEATVADWMERLAAAVIADQMVG
jgi:hypothetical protein